MGLTSDFLVWVPFSWEELFPYWYREVYLLMRFLSEPGQMTLVNLVGKSDMVCSYGSFIMQ